MLVLCVSVIHSMRATVVRKPDFYILVFAQQSLHVNAVYFSKGEVLHDNIRC